MRRILFRLRRVAEVDVRASAANEYEVVIREGSSSTTHAVSLTSEMRAELGVSDVDGARLVQESFRFLLERESKESILARFELTVITRYFPHYPQEIRRRLESG